MAEEPPQKKVRRPNFSDGELLMMITEVVKRRRLLIKKKFDFILCHWHKILVPIGLVCVWALHVISLLAD